MPQKQKDSQRLYSEVDTSQLERDASMHLLPYVPFSKEIITHAKNIYIYTSTGHRILDWTSGQMSCLIGHGHPEVVETIRQHAEQLDHLFSGMTSPPVIALGKELTGLLPPGLDKAMFLSTGGESNEVAIRLAKAYTGKFEIVGLSESWHGMTGAAQGAQYKTGRTGAGPLVGTTTLKRIQIHSEVYRFPETTSSQHQMRTAHSSGTQMVRTIGAPSSTTAGAWSTKHRAARLQL